MKFILFEAPPELKEVFTNLMQFYYYDFSEYLGIDTEANGKFDAYPNLDDYWKGSPDRFPYLIKVEPHYAGFALVKRIQTESQNYFSMAEFFVLRKYRLNKIGEVAAIELFERHQGNWQVFQRLGNKPAQLFWKKTIAKYTKGNFTEYTEGDKIIQVFHTF